MKLPIHHCVWPHPSDFYIESADSCITSLGYSVGNSGYPEMEPWVVLRGEGFPDNLNATDDTFSGAQGFAFRLASHKTSDPEYPCDAATVAVSTKYKKDLGQYTKEILDVLIEMSFKGEELLTE